MLVVVVILELVRFCWGSGLKGVGARVGVVLDEQVVHEILAQVFEDGLVLLLLFVEGLLFGLI